MARQKNLTIKEQKAVELVLEGKSQNQAVMEAFDCKNMASARSLAYRVFKRELVRNELNKMRQELRIELAGKVKRFIEVLNKHVSQEEVAQRLASLIKDGEARPAMKAIESYLRLHDEFPAGKSKIVGLFENIKTTE